MGYKGHPRKIETDKKQIYHPKMSPSQEKCADIFLRNNGHFHVCVDVY